MGHRIRLAMESNPTGLMGEDGGIVEADETYVGRKWRSIKRAGAGHKHVVFSLVSRTGEARSVHITGNTFEGIKASLKKNVSPNAVLMTDDARMYRKIAKQFADHKVVNHTAREYVRGNAHTNTIEGFFSVFKRGITGVYQHVSGEHLHRYLSEFDFRYNNRAALEVNDQQRADKLLEGIVGKRLTYATPH